MPVLIVAASGCRPYTAKSKSKFYVNLPISKCWLENFKKHDISMGKCTLGCYRARAYCHKHLSLDREEARRVLISLSATLI